jgi:5-methylcytosine-specific restriction endonuclease McrA
MRVNADERRKKKNAWLKERSAKGLCRQCGCPRMMPYTLCDVCKSKAKVYKNPKPRDRARLRSWQKEHNQKKRLEVLQHYGGKCVCCGQTNPLFLTIDHKNSDGNRDPRARGRSGFRISGLGWYMKLIKLGFPDDFQVLCWNCNHAKEIYGGGIACPCSSTQPVLLTGRLRFRKA